jgi:hypothetical protein
MSVIKAHKDLQSSLRARRHARDLRRSREPINVVFVPGMLHPLDRESFWQHEDVAQARKAILEAVASGCDQTALLLEYAEASATVYPREAHIALAELISSQVLSYADSPGFGQILPGPLHPLGPSQPSPTL